MQNETWLIRGPFVADYKGLHALVRESARETAMWLRMLASVVVFVTSTLLTSIAGVPFATPLMLFSAEVVGARPSSPQTRVYLDSKLSCGRAQIAIVTVASP